MNKINKKISDINKLILFNFSQLRNSVLFWLLFSLFLISQPLIICIIYFSISVDLLSYSLLIILIPLIFAFIFMLFQICILFQDNKSNSIEYKLICSKYSKLKVSISRIISIYISLSLIIVFQDLFLTFFISFNISKFLIALFVSNTFISSFIYLFLMLILVLISLKLRKIAFIIFSIIIGIISLGTSLISRPLIGNVNNLFQYNNPDSSINFIRLINENDDVLMVNNKPDEYKITGIEIINKIRKTYYFNNFIPSEWLMSFYSLVFSNLNFDLSYKTSNFNLLTPKIYEIINEVSDDEFISYYAIRVNDDNFLSMSDKEYFSVILNEIDSIITKYDFKNNQLRAQIIYQFLMENQNWYDFSNSFTSNSLLSINFLKDVLGINGYYNQLFYAIKYKELILSKIPNLFIELKNKYNNTISNLFEYVLTDESIEKNISNTNLDILDTKEKINYFYPYVYNIVSNSRPSEIDLNFLKNSFIKFDENNLNQVNLTYLMNNLSYSLANNNLQKFNTLLPNVVDYQSWSNYLDSISTYSELSDLLLKMNLLFDDIYQYQLSNNSLSIYDVIIFLKLKLSYSNSIAYLTTTFYILLFISLILSFVRLNLTKSKKGKKYD